MTYLQLAAHLFMLVFWMRVWVNPAQSFTFNPFLAGVARFGDRVVAFLYPALRLSGRPAAVALLVFFWVFQAMFFVRFGKAWQMTFGLFQFSLPGETLAWGMTFAHSGLYSAQFLIQAWTLYFFTRLIASPNSPGRAQEVFTFFMAPFSRLPLLLQLFVLVALHAALVVAVIHAGALPSVLDLARTGDKPVITGMFSGGAFWVYVKIGSLAMMSFVSGLQTLMYTLIFFLFGGLAAVLFGMRLPSLICRESVDVLLGRFSRSPAAAGGLDFTPVFFIIVVSLITSYFQSSLFQLIMKLPSV